MIDVMRAWEVHAGAGFDPSLLVGGESVASRWGEVFEARADSIALSGDTGTVSYGGLDDLTRRVAGGLGALGVRPGDRVAVIAPTSLAFVATYVALLRIGAVFLPVNTAYREAEVSRIFANGRPALAAVGDADAGNLVRAVAPYMKTVDLSGALKSATASFDQLAATAPAGLVDQVSSDAPAVIAYTSGTTGASKGAVLSHGNLLAGVRSVIMAWGWREEESLLLNLPLFHLHGLGVGLTGTLVAGSRAHVHDRLDSGRVFADIEAHGLTMIFGVPTMFRRLVDSQEHSDLSSLRLVVCGSAPLSEALFKRITERFGVEPLERYGMTETLMNISNPLVGERRPGSVGLPLPGVEIRLVADGTDVVPGDEGEIWLRGPNVFSRYWHDTEATRRSFTDGWFMSGDLARADDDGYLRISGRAKDLIITGGYNVHPSEVEDVVSGHPRIGESAVVGVPSEEWGEEVVAFVVPNGDVDLDEIREFCSQYLARYKVPKRFVTVDELPRNALGKLQRHLLRPTPGG